MTTLHAPVTVHSDRLLYRPEEAAHALALGRSTVYELMAAGELRYIKVGRCRRIRRNDLERYVADLAPESAPRAVES
ncbi:helix-turn-helix domain-containing protein [Streptomyces sp. NPDC020965]|uniref:helix-turn-helix domain-containing protein n=1 Tax=Streptomyces sp. NPDC020965 TaxID=3365105 RepID=UPI00379D543F